MFKLALTLITLALGGVLALQWRDWPPAAAPSQPVLSPDALAQSTPGGLAPDALAKLGAKDASDTFVNMTERPLFRPDRRPEPPPEEEPEAPPPPEPSVDLSVMDLTAVVITPGLVSAWVKDPKDAKLKRLRIGDDFQGWSVSEIREDRLVLQRQGEKDAILLRDYTKSAPPLPSRPARRQRPPRQDAPDAPNAPDAPRKGAVVGP